MAGIQFMNLKKLRKVITEVPDEKLVFWLGAGIDSQAPTSLPLGNGLTDHMLALTCGNYMERLLKVWKHNQKLIFDSTAEKVKLPERPRLESIIEAVREFELHQINRTSVLEGIRAFSASNLRPNQEHYTLSSFLHRGANIVTTNYGDFICKAFEEMYGGGTICHVENEIHTYRIKNEWLSCIYHIHGISSDLDTIGANLSTVKNSLAENFKSKFRYWLNHGYYFIFMGYSGLDSLDVNPFFKSISDSNQAVGIYVRHSKSEVIDHPTDKEEILLHPFQCKIICPCITGDFFHILKNYEDLSMFVEMDSQVKWRDIFNRYASRYSEEDSSALILGICYRLGISITLIFSGNWIEKTCMCKNVDQWYKAYYSFESAIMIGDQRKVKCQGKILLKEENRLMSIDYNTARGKMRKVVKSLDSPVDLLKVLIKKSKNIEVIDWDISTPLNRHTEAIVFKVVRSPFRMRSIIKKLNNQEYILNLLKCHELIIDAGYDAVVDINQINTAYRSLALCQVMNYQKVNVAIDNSNIVLDNYADVSSIKGIALTILYQAVIWMIAYSLDNNRTFLLNAQQNLNAAQRIIFGCNLLRYSKRYYATMILFRYLNFISGLKEWFR